MDFAPFDVRHYPTVAVREGYREWASTYEAVVQDEMDLRLLEGVTTVAWDGVGRAIDLACGTGRIGQWLHGRRVGRIDGVDLTPEMLAKAQGKGVYESLVVGDMRATGREAARYDLAIEVLADEHIPALPPLYREAARLTVPSGRFVIVGYHPYFLMAGIPTHFHRADGSTLAIESHVHLMSDHVRAGLANGWVLLEMAEGLIDDAWLEKKPKWRRHAGRPVSFVMVWGGRINSWAAT
jgi:SAM-dependent methyltransferase